MLDVWTTVINREVRYQGFYFELVFLTEHPLRRSCVKP